MDELAGAESMNVDLRKLAFDVREQVEIPLERQFGMMPALHQNLRAAESNSFLDFSVDLVVSNHVGIVVTFHAVEGAKFAINVTDVGVIDVPVDDVGDDLIATPIVRVALGQNPSLLGQCAEFFKRQMVKAERFGLIDSPAIPDLLEQGIQRGVVNHNPI